MGCNERNEDRRERKPDWVYPHSPPNTPVTIYSITQSTLVKQVLCRGTISLCHCQSVSVVLISCTIYSLFIECSAVVWQLKSPECLCCVALMVPISMSWDILSSETMLHWNIEHEITLHVESLQCIVPKMKVKSLSVTDSAVARDHAHGHKPPICRLLHTWIRLRRGR